MSARHTRDPHEQLDPQAPAEAGTLPAAASTGQADVELPPGTILARRYVIRSRLGGGAMGLVYAARDRALDLDVAIKVLRTRWLDDPGAVARLHAEVRAARAIDHAGVCHTHDLVHSSGLVFVVMELVRGETLAQRISAGLPLEAVLDLSRQLGAALMAAHRAGVVHCDVKPQNLIVSGDRLVLMDFGLARLASQPGVRELAGTPGYMAPEQAQGGEVDERTDVFGLSGVVFAMLSGRPPLVVQPGETTGRTLARVISEPVDPTLAIRPEWPAAARPALERALAHGLAKEPADRADGVETFLAELVAAFAAAGVGERRTRRSQVPEDRGEQRAATVLHVQTARPHAELFRGATAVAEDAGGIVVATGARHLVAVFGAEASRGDEPVVAAEAARAAIKLFAQGGVEATAGVAAGRLEVGRTGAQLAVRGAPLEAARGLAAFGLAGEVLAGSELEAPLSRRFAVTRTGDRVVIGSRRAADSALGPSTLPLLGRDRELGLILESFAGDAPIGGALVIGQPGIGKSRVAAEAVDALERSGLHPIVATAQRDDALAPFAVIRQMLGGLLELTGPASADEIRRRAMQRLSAGARPGVPWLGGRLLDTLVALLETRDVDRGPVLLPAARDALLLAGSRRPLLVVIDDAQWADDATLDLVELLLESPHPSVRVCLFARPELLVRRPACRRRVPLLIELPPLGPDDAFRLARFETAGTVGADEMRALVEAAEGNPFFVEELARGVRERHGAAGPAPATVEQALQARLDQLDPEARQVLRTASVLGRDFLRADLLHLHAAMAAPGTPSALEAHLDAQLDTLRRRFLVVVPPGPDGTRRLMLKHHLLRDVAYAELPPETRRRLHTVAAQPLQEIAGSRADHGGVENLVRLAVHLEAAGQIEEAASMLALAGGVSEELGAQADALRCYVRARELVGAGSDFDLELRFGRVALALGQSALAGPALRAIVDLAPSAGDRAEVDRLLGILRERA